MQHATRSFLIASAGFLLGALAAGPSQLLAQAGIVLSAPATAQSPAADVGGLAVSAKAAADQRAFWHRMRATPRSHGYPRPGHTVRHGQRMARKTRAQAANRRAHRA